MARRRRTPTMPSRTTTARRRRKHRRRLRTRRRQRRRTDMGRYLTAAQLITRLGLDPVTDEDLLEEYIESAEAAIDGETGRRFDSVTETRRFDITEPGEYLSVGDLVSVTAVGVAGSTGGDSTTLTATDYFLGPSVRPAGYP